MSLKQLSDRILFRTDFKTEIPDRAQYTIICEKPADNVKVKIECFEDDEFEYIGGGEAGYVRGYVESEEELLEVMDQIDEQY